MLLRNPDASLADVYAKETGQVFIRGIQALARLPIVQVRNDRKAGLNTGGYISGYRGSPLGTYDTTLAAAKPFLEACDIHARPAVNEELAACQVWGTQQLHLSPGARKDGVLGIWYGKGPGVDRTGDVFRHGNVAGSSRHGGVLCIAGDDHAAKSSDVAHQTDYSFMSAMMPLLYPSGPHELVTMGLFGFALSRFSGCWVGMKAIADTCESSGLVDLAEESRIFTTPTDFVLPPGGFNLRWPDDRFTQDERLVNHKVPAAIAFARANNINRITLDAPDARLGIATSGKSHEEVHEALGLLGITPDVARRVGLKVLKIGMIWPLDPIGIRAFAQGLEEILVIEERREVIENQIKQHLANVTVRPRVVGKFDEADKSLLPLQPELSIEQIVAVIAARLLRLALPEDVRTLISRRAETIAKAQARMDSYAAPVARVPYFCAGCPHNTSTVTPDGSRTLAGIGCHFMAMWMDRAETFTPMGCEGAPWLGMAPFTDEKHVFVNIGDGTYFHSGILAIRQAVASGANVTYKILFNDAVAMTGGQPVDGTLTVPDIVRQVTAEGARKVVVVSKTPERFEGVTLAPGVAVKDRTELDNVMRELREERGCTILVYDQGCATELRRKRARGKVPKASTLAFINDAVCEGCGDCSVQSNCVAIEPLETQMGRKRAINQSMCNADLSCVKGFCPSFVTVEGAKLRKGSGIALPAEPLPEPVIPAAGAPINIAVTGVGGTGVLTVGHVLGMAAYIDGVAATVSDMAGLAQKGGAVLSQIRLAADPGAVRAPHIPVAQADILLAPDMVVATSGNVLGLLSPERSVGVVDTHLTPVAGFIADRDFDFRATEMLGRLQEAVKPSSGFIDFHGLAVKALGDALAANTMMIGFAWQRGLLPLSEAALRKAITLNGVAVEFNLKAFQWGRFAAAYPDRVPALIQGKAAPALADMSLDEIIAQRVQHLTGYQGPQLAAKYRAAVDAVRAKEHAVSGKSALTRAVAVQYANVLAYKDEYEVARLYGAPAFRERLAATFDGAPSLHVHLSPPLLARPDPNTGRPRKIKFGPWVFGLFSLLAKFKGLRGGALDVFGRTEERKRERALIAQYESALALIGEKLTSANHAQAVALVSAPAMVRGFGPVKMKGFAQLDQEWPALEQRFRNPPVVQPAAPVLERALS